MVHTALLIAAGVLAGTQSRDAMPPAPPSSARCVVLMVPADPDGRTARALAAIRSSLSDVPCLTIAEIDPWPSDTARQLQQARDIARGAGLVLWLELSAGADATVYLTDAAGERIAARWIPLPEGDDEFEGVGIIARSSLAVLLGGGQLGPRLALPEPQKDAKAPEGAGPWSLEVGVEALAATIRQPQPGLFAGVSRRLDDSVEAAATVRLFQPIRLEQAGTTLMLQRYSAALSCAYAWTLGPIRTGPAVAVTLGYASGHAWSRDPGQETRDPEARVMVSLLPSLRTTWVLSARLAIVAELGAELFAIRTSYRVRLASGEEESFDSPWGILRAGAGLAVPF